ncbi:centrosome-associated protein 350-like [Diorhabda carinulata]|uniref:centrosome-associated protein 350-like n=1 Tax=Diorhabda carinulata TaxID=1163345 RepID=UPI0025A01B3F|nr:centrosome-associated protein 350-like [Diorhabda carinulata]
MSDETGIVKKIIETKKQTEELKTQLQNLIDEGKNLFRPSQSTSNLLISKNEEPLKSPNKVQIMKSYENKHSQQKSDPNIPKKTENTDVPKKSRSYDVKEARKYIKKQKEKRLEQSKVNNESKINAELQKQKLQELHKKSMLLLAQNVRAKRERSNTRDKNTYVRPQDTTTTQNIGRSKSMDRISSTGPGKSRNPNLLYPPSPTFKNKSLDPNVKATAVEKGQPEKFVILARNFTRGATKREATINQSASITFRQKIDLDKNTNETRKDMENIQESNNDDQDVIFKPNDGPKIKKLHHLTTQNLFNKEFEESDNQILSSVKPCGDSIKNILEYKSPLSNISNITIRPQNASLVEKANETCTPKQTLREDNSVNKKAEGIAKHSKEIQTEIIHNECPKWLKEQPPQAYPFNFINTVTRKLQVANSQKLKTDIGIQNSLMSPTQAEKKEIPPTDNKVDSNCKTDLKSFITHTCLNLDPAAIEHLELIPKKTYDTQKISTHITETESESDTSKNIPEISSESGTSLKKNKESVRKALTINTDKIDNMKLISHRSASLIPTQSSNNNQKYGNKSSYASDFNTDIETESSLDRSRRSIISFNRSGYNKVIIPQPEQPSVVPSPRSQTSRSKNASTINTDDLSKSIRSNRNESESRFGEVKEGGEPTTEHYNVDDEVKNSEDQIITSSKNSAADTEIRMSSSISTNLSRSINKNINSRRGSSSLKEENETNVVPLSEPKISLTKDADRIKSNCTDRSSQMVRNLSVRSSKVSTKTDAKDANQIHLKFEAEIHLLNDFNESLRRFSALEQALETLKTNNTITSKNLRNGNVETSSKAPTKTNEKVRSKENQSQMSQINFSRGSFINTSIGEDLDVLANSALDKDTSLLSTGLEVSNLNSIDPSMSVNSLDHLSNFENLQNVNCAGLSLNMFEQLIKDEDARLENLKTILKIREQALLDRTKGELAWLEIQRKHFKETGKLHEASVIKKKQRAILVNHQKEKHEMQRLKQMQKAASIERKIVLKGHRNLIRQQLSTDNMLTKMKVHVPKERRSSGPLKVLQSHTESIRSETSITKRSSSDREKDVLSITSTTHHSIISEVSEIDVPSKEVPSLERQNCIKRTLLMREEALRKRRKAAEELLQWHKKLLEEEKRITVLESAASAIISQKPNTAAASEKFNFKGKQLNQLWFNLTGSEGKKFVDDKIYPMSQLALERFCKSAREYSLKTKTLLKKSSENDMSVSENIPTQKTSSDNDYVSDFEVESSPIIEEPDVVDQSIDILINNFNQIQDDISTLNISRTRKSDESRSDEIASEAEISVIETNTLLSNKQKAILGLIEDDKETIDEKFSEELNTSPKMKTDSSLEESVKTDILELEMNGQEPIKRKETPNFNDNNKELIDEISEELMTSVNENSEKLITDIPELEPNKNEIKKQKVTQGFDENNKESIHDNSEELKTSIKENSEKIRTHSILEESSKTHVPELELNEKEPKKRKVTPSFNENNKESIDENSEEMKTSVKEISEKLRTDSILEESSKTHVPELELNEKEPKKRKLTPSFNENNKESIDENSEEMKTSVKEISEKLKTDSILEESLKTDIPQLELESVLADSCEKSKSSPKNIELIIIKDISVTFNEKINETKFEKTDVSNTNISRKINDISIPHKTFIDNELTKDDLLVQKNIVDDIAVEEPHINTVSTETKESLNESQEILSILGETEVKTGSDEEIVEDQTKNNLTETEEILSKLSHIVTVEDTSRKEREKSKEEPVLNTEDETELTGSPLKSEDLTNSSKTDQDMLSESLIRLYVISGRDQWDKDDNEVLQDVSSLEQIITNGLDESKFLLQVKDLNQEESGKIEETNVVNTKWQEGDDELKSDEENEESKLIESDKSNESFIINDDVIQKQEDDSEESEKSSKVPEEIETGEDYSITEEVSSAKTSSKPISNLSYGIIEKSRVEYTNDDTDVNTDKEDGCQEEKEHDSLSSNVEESFSDLSEQVSMAHGDIDKNKTLLEEKIDDSLINKSNSEVTVDVKKRVSEILSDTNASRGDKSPRLQDIYVTTYDLISPTNSPERAPSSPIEEHKLVTSIFNSEAEELLRKQLAVEQEIKAITEQQKEQLPLMYIREIPNKPPPPYIPPSPINIITTPTIIPTAEEIEEITLYSAKILHKAYLSNNLTNVSISNNTLSLISKNISKDCYKFVFNLCKEIAQDHYKQFEEDNSPPWLRIQKKIGSGLVKPLDTEGLKIHMIKNLKELFGYERSSKRDNNKIKWIKKKRDHVDEILVVECQQEETQWTNYRKDELLVKDNIVNEIFDSLLIDTAQVFKKIFLKRNL